MAACEKCWEDARRRAGLDVANEYTRLILERAGNPCTPEEQAGPGRRWCPECKRHTVHQHAMECVVCGLVLHEIDTGS